MQTPPMNALNSDAIAGVAATSSPKATPHALASEYFPAFDWLRAVLAVTVMLAHDNVLVWAHSGPFAVQIFFALSGWLIGGILLKTSAADLPRFYFNRALRIWVPYYIAFLLLLAVSLLKDPVTGKWLEFVTYKLFMVWNIFGTPQLAEFQAQMPLQGTGTHFWSVNAEEQFYLLSPVLLVLAPKWGRSPLVWLVLSTLALASASTYSAILLGVLAAVAVARYGNFHSSARGQKVLAMLLVMSAVGLYAGAGFALFSSVFGISAVLLLATPGEPSFLGKVAGGMSYPLYLNHWVGVFVGNFLLSPFGLRDSPARQVLAAGVSIGFAVVLYLLVDRPLLARRQSWYRDHYGRTIRWVAYAMVGLGGAYGSVVFLLSRH